MNDSARFYSQGSEKPALELGYPQAPVASGTESAGSYPAIAAQGLQPRLKKAVKRLALGFPVPDFSLRVGEMQIDTARNMGSHELFLATTVEGRRSAEGLESFHIHGFYEAWRSQKRRLG